MPERLNTALRKRYELERYPEGKLSEADIAAKREWCIMGADMAETDFAV